MTTQTAQESYNKDRIRETWELPRGAKVQVSYKRTSDGGKVEEGECVAVFDKMDGMYGLWYDEETGKPLIFGGHFVQIDQDCFYLLSRKELDELKGTQGV